MILSPGYSQSYYVQEIETLNKLHHEYGSHRKTNFSFFAFFQFFVFRRKMGDEKRKIARLEMQEMRDQKSVKIKHFGPFFGQNFLLGSNLGPTFPLNILQI